MSYIPYPVLFDSRNIEDVPGLTVLATDAFKPAKRKLVLLNIARTDQSKLNSSDYEEKIITIRASIVRSTRALAETSFDTLMSYLQGNEKELIVRQSGLQRKWTATYEDTVFEVSGGAYLEFDIIFRCSDPFGYELTLTQIAFANAYTSASRTDTFTPGGSAPWQVPLIFVTYTAVSGAGTVNIGNENTGQQITVTRTFTAGEVLKVDSYNKLVTINGTEIDFAGAWPEFKPNVFSYLNYNDTFSSRTIRYYAYYYKRYI